MSVICNNTSAKAQSNVLQTSCFQGQCSFNMYDVCDVNTKVWYNWSHTKLISGLQLFCDNLSFK